jgi:hypothetical protein
VRNVARLDFSGSSMNRKEFVIAMQASLRQSLAVSAEML